MKNRFGKIFAGLAALFVMSGTCWACFATDPTSGTGNPATTITGGGGSTTDVVIPGHIWDQNTDARWDIPDNGNEYALTIRAAFPITLNVSFSGFVNDSGDEVTEPITRMCVLYFSTSGKWIILKDIKNPAYTVIGTAENKRALFGKHTIPSALGYASGEAMPVLLYFKSANYENFSLDEVLASNNPKPLNSSVICLVPSGNNTPF